VTYEGNQTTKVRDNKETKDNFSSPNSRRGTLLRTGTVMEQEEEYLSSGSTKRKKTTMNNTRVLKDINSNKKLERDRFEKISTDTLKTIPPLVKIDFNMDYLKNFLEDLQKTINE
jgi:hypothetical protein